MQCAKIINCFALIARPDRIGVLSDDVRAPHISGRHEGSKARQLTCRRHVQIQEMNSLHVEAVDVEEDEEQDDPHTHDESLPASPLQCFFDALLARPAPQSEQCACVRKGFLSNMVTESAFSETGRGATIQSFSFVTCPDKGPSLMIALVTQTPNEL